MIRVEALGKKYVLGQGGQPGHYTALRDVLASAVKAPFQRWREGTARKIAEKREEDFWALRDVNMDVRRGDVVGIIGRNGAGKSTLLKILSRITEPTQGKIRLRGRVASLLEVGTGFHPELTGRENIFLNGAILGMSRAEIRAKFDEIVAFAEVERFLDTPVKRYSSGMYVRLAFAVAAHLEPEILIVDEVLAVGDAEFQKKCIGKMNEVARGGGRTVIFVSHNMGAVQSLCGRCVYLKSGRLEATGETADVIAQYQAVQKTAGVAAGETRLTEGFKLEAFRLEPGVIKAGAPVTIHLAFASLDRNVISELCLLMFNEHGQRMALIDLRANKLLVAEAGRTTEIRVEIAAIPFVEGSYTVGLWIDSAAVRQECADLSSFEVLPPVSDVTPYERNLRGLVELDATFEVASLR